MSEERKAAIRGERQKSSNRGLAGFCYVKLDLLEREGIGQFRAEEGDNFIRILPPFKDDEFFGKEVHVHRGVGVDNRTFLCPKKMWDKRCPICEEATHLLRIDPGDETVKELRPSLRYLFFVVNVKMLASFIFASSCSLVVFDMQLAAIQCFQNPREKVGGGFGTFSGLRPPP